MPEGKNRDSPVKVPEHVFIAQGPRSGRGDHSRLVSSQARRFQSASKRQQQRLSARSHAGYAQSLVGWRSMSSPTPSTGSQGRKSASPLRNDTPKGRAPTKELEEHGEASQPQIDLAIRTGIRSDPFSAFPSSNTKTVMMLVDYCTSLHLRRNFARHSFC